MHNNIMAAGFKMRSTNVGPGRYFTSRLRFLTVTLTRNQMCIYQTQGQRDYLNLSQFLEVSDPEQAQRDKDMQKNLELLAKYFKRLYKPTNNNLQNSSNSRNKTEDTTPRYNNDNQSGQFGNQRTITVAGARETIGSPVVQQKGYSTLIAKDLATIQRNAGSQSVLKTTRITRKRRRVTKSRRFGEFHLRKRV
ncbi:hypothetical protein Tco_0322647, partial [Tanacetum coccineum]